MNTIKIIADTAQEALEQVQAKVGPDAVILNVRPVHADGVKRLWSKARVEVLATAPEPPSAQENVLQLLTAKVHQLEGALQGTEPSQPIPPNVIQMIQNVGGTQDAPAAPPTAAPAAAELLSAAPARLSTAGTGRSMRW